MSVCGEVTDIQDDYLVLTTEDGVPWRIQPSLLPAGARDGIERGIRYRRPQLGRLCLVRYFGDEPGVSTARAYHSAQLVTSAVGRG